jgi:hypothetical protein
MRSASLLIAAGFALAVVGQAFAQTQGATPPTAPPESTAPVTSDTSPPAVPESAPSTTAPSASTSGANTSATAGAPALSVGEPVKDNTGAIIGSISGLNTGASGQQMAVIKMGTDTFQAPTDRLGVSNGAAMINMTQAQISGMLHPANGGR